MRCDDCGGNWFGLIIRAGVSMSNLAMIYRALGRYADALALFERVLELKHRIFPANHPGIGEGCMGRDVLRNFARCVIILRAFVWFDSTCRHGHG